MEQMLLAYGIPKEALTVISIVYKNSKVMARSLDGDTDFFDLVSANSKIYPLTHYPMRVRPSKVDRSNKRKWLCNVMAEGFRFMPLSLVRLRAFRLSTWVS